MNWSANGKSFPVKTNMAHVQNWNNATTTKKKLIDKINSDTVPLIISVCYVVPCRARSPTSFREIKTAEGA